MDEVFEQARKLSQCIEASGVHEAYTAALTAVRNNPGLAAGIREFKRIQMDYHTRGELNFDQEKHLSSLYFNLCMNPDAKNFLESEKQLLGLMLDVQERLWADCNVSLEFLG